MSTEITGRCWTCGDEVTVYQVISEDHWTMDRLDGEAMGNWVFESMENDINGKPGGFKKLGFEIIIAGKDFGCGSKSVEHPMAALKGAGIKLIVAESVSRYSYRNAINLALPIIICPGITSMVHRDDVITVDIARGTIKNSTTGKKVTTIGLGEFALDILSAGGLLKYVAGRMNKNEE